MLIEQEMVRICARPDLNTGQIEQTGQLLAKGVDWHLLLKIAHSHRIFPLLYVNLVNHFQDSIPSDIAREWKELFRENSARNLFLAYQLLKIIDLFANKNIEAIPFKGPVLSEHLFGDINRRTYGDLDILLAKSDLEKAVSLLQQEGLHFDIDLGFDQYMQLAHACSHAVMVKEKPPCMVELHWEMTGRCLSQPLELKCVRPRLCKIQFMGRQVLSLSPEDLLVYLCIHGTRHYWKQLDSICCVAGLISREKELDWVLAQDIAERFGARRMVLIGCLLAHELLNVSLNSSVAENISNETGVNDVVAGVVKELFGDSPEPSPNSTYWNELKYYWKTLDNFADWFHCSMKPLLLPTHSDWMWLRLPASLSWFYRVLRPIRLSAKYTREFISRGR